MTNACLFTENNVHKKHIYLAVPYSHPSAEVRERRFMAVSRRAAVIMRRGDLVFSPVTHGHSVGLFGSLPCEFDFWRAHCLSFLRVWAHELHVLGLDGWDKSAGVLAEMEEAERIGLPVIMLGQGERQ